MAVVHRVTRYPLRRPPPAAPDVERDRLAEVWQRAHVYTRADLHDVGVWAVAHGVTLSAALDEMRRPR